MGTNGSDIVSTNLKRKLIGKLSNKEVGQLLIRYLPERKVWYVSMDIYGMCKEHYILDTFELTKEKYKEFLEKIKKQNVLYVF